MKKRLLLTILALSMILAGVYFFSTARKTRGLTKVERFKYIEPGEGACLALAPECGECYGQVINKECYIDKSKLSEDQLKYMGLK